MPLMVSSHQHFQLNLGSLFINSLDDVRHGLSLNIEGLVVVSFPRFAFVHANEDATLRESASLIKQCRPEVC